MVTRSKKEKATEKRRRVKVGELKLNKETVKDLSAGEQRKIEGGVPKSGGWENGPCGSYWCGLYPNATQLYKGGPCGNASQLDCV